MQLRLLFVEDTPDDAELMLHRLREGGIEPQWLRVDSEFELRAALASESWQVALVDYDLPGFGGPRAIRLLAELAPETPAITVSGAIDEDTAVATITAGAVDYVLKDNLIRLVPAVRRAVDGAELRSSQLQAAETARRALHALDNASLAITRIVEDGTVAYANDMALVMMGRAREDVVGRKLWEVDSGYVEETWGHRWAELRRLGAIDYERTLSTPQGQEIALGVFANYVEFGEEPYIIMYSRDISEQRAFEAQAEQSEARYRRIVETATEGIWAIDAAGLTTLANQQMATMLGYSPEELEGRPMTDFLFPEDHADHALKMKERREGSPGRHERRFRAKDGREVWTSVSASAKLGPDGAFEGSFGMFADITGRRVAEEGLRVSEERFEQFAAHFPGYLFMQDEDLRYVYVNPHPTKPGDVAPAYWIGRTPEELWPNEDTGAADAAVARAAAGEVVDVIETWHLTGRIEHLHSLYFPIDRGDEPPLVGGISMDVTRQIEAEEEVRRQAEQLRRTVEGTVLAMSQVVETRDPYTAGHERRVTELATAIAVEMGLGAQTLTGLRLGGPIHDIGKIAVPAEILARPGRLSPVEYNLVKQHAQAGYDILEPIDFGLPVAKMSLQHHERLDGSGYPQGLTGDEILLEAKILAVADVVEAMSSHRPYRPSLGMEAALAEVGDGAGRLYDAGVVAACRSVVVDKGFAFTT